MRHKKPNHKHIAVCYRCYSCWLTPKPVSKREANIIAASHMTHYHHDTSVRELNDAELAAIHAA